MADPNPARLAQLDQSVARVDESVDRYTKQVAEKIATVGKGEAIADFHVWLLQQPRDAVAALAAGALARLAELTASDGA